MRVLEWGWINYKSFGSTKFKVELNQEKGELILLSGQNGSGKTSLITSLDSASYGEELNKRGTKLAKSNFPNRVNGNMEVWAKYQTDHLIEISRSMNNTSSPLKTKLTIDGVPYDKANKVDEKIEGLLGIDYKTYKSFISMNVNNFKNFISLTPEEKRILLDKLFNLEQINSLNKIIKALQKENDVEYNSIKTEISIYQQNLTDLQQTIKSITEQNNVNNDLEIEKLKTDLQSNKTRYIELETLLETLQTNKTNLSIQQKELSEEYELFKSGINDLKLKLNDINRDISDINQKIDLYTLGKCPTCTTELVGELNLLPEYQQRLELSNKIKDKISKKIDLATIEANTIKSQLDQLNNSLNETNNQYSETNIQLNKIIQIASNTKDQLKQLKNPTVNSLDQFDKNISDINDKIESKQSLYIESQKLKYAYDILLPIWGEQGIKRDMIESIIDPLNQFIQEDLSFLRTRFTVELDNNFDAHIYEFNNEIDTETLSSGEAKKINLIIMLAYIKMLRMKRDINVLFLDEVFTTIDLEGIDDILKLFKKFANERNINIFLVHHSELKEWFFDKIISVKKNTFSYIETKVVS